MIKHPAKYTDIFIPIFAKYLKGCKTVLDPFAGTGKLALIKYHGFKGRVICSEIEPEWANCGCYDVDEWYIGDSSKMPWKDGSFDAICTSPTYGNRMADHFNARDGSKRNTYKDALGRHLSVNNSGRMQWGEKYRKLHIKVYIECQRVLKDKGILIINTSDHIRGGKVIEVGAWHRDTLKDLGFNLSETIKIPTPRNRFGENYELRVDYEHIFIFEKGS